MPRGCACGSYCCANHGHLLQEFFYGLNSIFFFLQYLYILLILKNKRGNLIYFILFKLKNYKLLLEIKKFKIIIKNKK